MKIELRIAKIELTPILAVLRYSIFDLQNSGGQYGAR